MELHLMRPEWLWSLLPALLLTVLLWRQRGRSGSWNNVIAAELLPFLVGERTGGRRANLLPLILLAWVVAAVAASGPSWEKIPQPIHQKQDALVLVLDLSYSMKSADLAPSRLDRARQKLLDLLEQRREGQTGLIAYAGDSHIVTPLTDDTPTIANLLPALNPDMMPLPGSDPAAAITQAVELMHSAGVRQGKILLLTDGVSSRDGKAVEKALRGTGMQLGVMGAGTTTGAPIPLPRGGFLKDDQGTIVMPTLEEQDLRELASAVNGRYMRMQIDDSDLDYLLSGKLSPDTEQTLALDRTADAWDDGGYWFILLLLPLVLALFRRGWLVCLLPLLFITQPQPAQAGAWDDLWLTPDQQARRALEQGDTETAADLFENPDWAGTAAYRSGDYETATERFSDNDSADGWYNRGNALARAGQLDEAIAAYRESLARKPEQRDARDNLELLEQLKQQQEQQQQQQQGDGASDEQQQQEQNQNPGQQEQSQGQQDQNQGQNQQQADQQNQQNPQNQPGQQEQSQDGHTGNEEQQSGDPGEEQQAQRSEQQPEPGQEGTGRDAAAQQAQAAPEEQERDQAMEQWLRRVPDDPSGLLREKFRYESRQRQEQGHRSDDETYW